jgi:spermidine synthase
MTATDRRLNNENAPAERSDKLRPLGRLPAAWLLVTAAAMGAGVMAVELLGARLLSAGYGGSLMVWAAMISVTLLSLAIGYFVGGLLSDRHPRPGLLYGVLLVASVLVAACPYERFVLHACYEGLGLRGGALASSAVLFFLPLSLLGFTGPFVIRLLSETRRGVGMTAGCVYAVSTLGSVAGTLLTGLWLVPQFGTTTGFLIAAATMAVVSCVGLILRLGVRAVCLLLLPGVVLFLPRGQTNVGQTYITPDGESALILAAHESSYAHLVVLRKERYHLLLADGIVQTGVPMDLARLQHCDLLRDSQYFQELLPYMIDDPSQANVLVIGLAGGMTATLLQSYGMDVLSVDLDPMVIELARKYFGFKGKAVAADGRQFLKDCSDQYDFCVIDTYSGDVFPFHMASEEAFATAKSVLKPGGVLAINFIGAPSGRAFACVYKTLGSVFTHVRALKGEPGDDVQTITVLASDRKISFNRDWLLHTGGFSGVDPITESIASMTVSPDLSDAFILTDDYNPIDFLRADEAVRWRKRTIESVGRPGAF